MSDNDLRQELGVRLRGLLRRKRLRQAELAKALQMTPSAVSQILSGKIVPAQSVFDRITDFLALTCDETEQLQLILLGIRSSMSNVPSPLNNKIFLVRQQLGCNSAELARRCGISVERMEQLENLPTAVPTAEEYGKLQQLFDNGFSSPEYKDPPPSVMLEVAEPKEPWGDQPTPQVTIVRFSPGDFAGFRPGDRLCDFLENHDFSSVPVSEFSFDWNTPVVVQGSTESFHLKPYGGQLQLIVVEVDSVEKPAFFFCGDGKGNCFLRGGSRESGLRFVPDRRFKAVWQLPVVIVNFRPAFKPGNKESEK